MRRNKEEEGFSEVALVIKFETGQACVTFLRQEHDKSPTTGARSTLHVPSFVPSPIGLAGKLPFFDPPFPDQQNNAQVMTCSHTMVSDLKYKDIYKGSTSEAPQDLLGQDEITPMEVCQAEDVELLANGLCKAKNFLSLIHFHFALRPKH